MSDKTKATLYNFVFGNLNNFITIFFGIILVPYYLKFFNVELYGVWIASAGVIALLGTLESGLSFIFTQKLADCYGKENIQGFSKYYVKSNLVIGSIRFFVETILVFFVVSTVVFYITSEFSILCHGSAIIPLGVNFVKLCQRLVRQLARQLPGCGAGDHSRRARNDGRCRGGVGEAVESEAEHHEVRAATGDGEGVGEGPQQIVLQVQEEERLLQRAQPPLPRLPHGRVLQNGRGRVLPVAVVAVLG